MRFHDWTPPEIKDGEPTRYQWIVRHTDKFTLGYKTDIGAFSYINAKNGVIIEDFVQIGSHCSIYSVSTATVIWLQVSGPSILWFPLLLMRVL